jgi:hypothetical protein
MRRPHFASPRQIAGRQVPGQQPPAPAAFLGADHPFVRGQARRGDLCRQSLVTAAAILLGAIGTASGRSWGLPLLVAAGSVQLGLGLGLVLLTDLQRERARELIVTGRGHLPLPAVQRELRRLRSPGRRAGLADALEDLVQAAERWPTLVPTCRPVFDPRQVRAAAAELRAIAACLRQGRVTVRAVARVEQLLSSGASPLYGREPEALRHELMRIRAELDRADPAEDMPERSHPQG